MEEFSISIECIFIVILCIIASGMCYHAFFKQTQTTSNKTKPRSSNNNTTTKFSKNNQNKSKETDLNLVLYANGLYESLEKPNALWTQGIEESEFNTIILWTLHIRINGDLVYNDFLMVSNGELQELYGPTGTNIAARIQELKTFGNVKLILFSIGSGSWYDEDGELLINPDFYNLHEILFNGTQQQKDNLFANLNVLINLGIDGFDSDCEEWGFFPDLTSQQLEDTHIQLFSDLYDKYPQLIFTFVPYRDRNNWLNIAKGLYDKLGMQLYFFCFVVFFPVF